MAESLPFPRWIFPSQRHRHVQSWARAFFAANRQVSPPTEGPLPGPSPALASATGSYGHGGQGHGGQGHGGQGHGGQGHGGQEHGGQEHGDDEAATLRAALEETTQRLRQSEERLRKARIWQKAILNSSRTGIITTDVGGKIQSANPRAVALAQAGDEQSLLQLPIVELFASAAETVRADEAGGVPAENRSPAGKKTWAQLIEQACQGAADVQELLLGLPGSTPTPVSVSITALQESGAEAEGFLFMMTDISARIQAEDVRQHIMDYSLDAICIMDKEGRFEDVSAACEKIWGYTRAELIGRPYLELVCPEDHARTVEVANAIMQGQPAKHFENRYIRADGSLVPITWSANWSPSDGHMYCVAHDNTERKEAEAAMERLNAELKQATEVAEKANLAKSEFLSRMSHELRTPMNAILGFGQILALESPRPSQREPIDQILRAGNHLLNLINEVLDITRIEAGGMPITTEPVNVKEVVAECLKLLSPLAAGKEVSLACTTASQAYVLADAQKLKQVLLNLLSNAVKYNQTGGTVEIMYHTASPDWLTIEVRDSGPGIKDEDQPKIFVPFERLNANNSGVEGTGLGLALSRRLMDAMGGEIGVHSTPGEGTTLWVKMPLAAPPAEPENIGLPGERSNQELVEDSAFQGKVMLYIEDNLSNLRLIERLVALHKGIHLISAMQGTMGLDLARQHKPDLILLDLHLPDINGDHVLASLQEDSSTRDIPVIILSADASPGQARRLKELGALEYLSKPLDIPKFVSLLKKYLGEDEGTPWPI